MAGGDLQQAAGGLTEEETVNVAGAYETTIGRALLKALRVQMARIEKRLDDPKLDTERVRDDFRYTLGELHGTRYLVDFVEKLRRAKGMMSEE